MITVTISVPDMPRPCPGCGGEHDSYPLAVFAGRVYLECPVQHVSVAALEASDDAQ